MQGSTMSGPQLENGYTRIANEILEALCRVNLSPYESRVLWFLLRKTYGWKKKSDRIALSQFSKGLRLDRRLVHRSLKNLSTEKKMIVISRDDKNRPTYGFQKDYSKWRMSSRKMTVIGRDDGVSSTGMKRVSSVEMNTKETITKERKKDGHELHGSSLSLAPPQPGKNGNGKDWGKRDWIPFFLHNQDYVSLPVEYFLNPQWWNNLFAQYQGQIGPGTLDRTFSFMGQHFIEQPHKRPKTKKGYLKKVSNLIRIQLERDETNHKHDKGMDWLGPQSDFMKKHFAERSPGEGS